MAPIKYYAPIKRCNFASSGVTYALYYRYVKMFYDLSDARIFLMTCFVF